MRTQNSRLRRHVRLLLTSLALGLLGPGCFTSPNKVDVSTIQCQVADDCPVGYGCKFPGRVGGCCKPSDLACGMGLDASQPQPDAQTYDGRTADGASTDFGTRDIGLGSGEEAAQSMDAKDAPGSVDGSSEVGTGAGGTAGPDGPQGLGGSSGFDGGRDVPADVPLLPSQDSGTGGISGTGGVIGTGGTGGTGGASGTCSVDKDCPAQSPLCLANKCAKCASDTDCVGRAGPACQTTSGLCVACTGDKYCTGTAAKCNATSNECIGCLTRSDCSGACQACTSGVCTPVKNQDNPGGCAGTCDSSGACKAKQGQTCQATADCAGGLSCADGYCCNSVCNQSCEACNLTGYQGTCTPLAASATPLSGHPACTSSDSRCPSTCQGGNTCSYSNNTPCGQATCSSDHLSYQYAGTCSNGTCNLPAAASCGTRKYCTGAGSCVAQTSGSCSNNYECVGNNCTGGICCGVDMTGCSGACTYLTADSANCGSCGHACSSTQGCCNGACQDVTNDSNNCGYCGNVCGSDSACGNGSCKLLDGKSCMDSSQCLNNNCATVFGPPGWCCPVGYQWCEGCIPNSWQC